MSRTTRYQYFVEGETEKKIIEEFKRTRTMIVPGVVRVLNVKQKLLSRAVLTNLSTNTVAVLVFDTDTKDLDILRENIRRLKKNKNVKDIWLIPQVGNLEDELVRSTDVKEIKDLIGCKSNSDFKRDVRKEKKLMEKLNNHNFNFNKMWSSDPGVGYSGIGNDGNKIKNL